MKDEWSMDLSKCKLATSCQVNIIIKNNEERITVLLPDSNTNIHAPLKNKNIPKQNSTELPNARI